MPPASVERLLSLAEQQSEGALDRSCDPPTYYGSTYFVLRLADVRAAFAGCAVRQMTASDLAAALQRHPWFRLMVLRTAREEAERRIGGALAPGTARVSVTAGVRAGTVTIEASIELPCRERGEPHAVPG